MYENVHQRKNVAGCYGWKRTAKCSDGTVRAFKREEETKISGHMAELMAFYRPHIEELHQMADAGLIARPPASWLAEER